MPKYCFAARVTQTWLFPAPVLCWESAADRAGRCCHAHVYTHTGPFLAPLPTLQPAQRGPEGPVPPCWPLATLPAQGRVVQCSVPAARQLPPAALGLLCGGRQCSEPSLGARCSPAFCFPPRPPPGHPPAPAMEGEGVPASPAPALPVSPGIGPTPALVHGWVRSPTSAARRSRR